MRIFDKKEENLNDIVSVIIIEQTQNYTKKAKAGLVFGDSLLNPDVMFMDGAPEPTGMTYTFSVTYRNGVKKIIKADSGTDLCDRLLQKALDEGVPSEYESSADKKMAEKAPELKKNQLPQGVYIIGQDIPSGRYDFHHVWGNGSLEVYREKETILGNLEFSEWIGDSQSYEKVDCINVHCADGWYLHVSGNLIVEISRSKGVEIDL